MKAHSGNFGDVVVHLDLIGYWQPDKKKYH